MKEVGKLLERLGKQDKVGSERDILAPLWTERVLKDLGLLRYDH